MVRRETSGRRRVIRVVLGSLIALLACGAPVAVDAQEEFKYGAVSPVTGPIPQFGEYFIRGSQLALEDLEKSGWIGGKKIRIVLEDGKNDPKISLAAMNKLLSVDKVPIVETVGSSVVLALGPVAQQQGVLLVNTAAQNPMGAQAGEKRLREVLTEAGFTRVRRVAETPANMILEVRA